MLVVSLNNGRNPTTSNIGNVKLCKVTNIRSWLSSSLKRSGLDLWQLIGICGTNPPIGHIVSELLQDISIFMLKKNNKVRDRGRGTRKCCKSWLDPTLNFKIHSFWTILVYFQKKIEWVKVKVECCFQISENKRWVLLKDVLQLEKYHFFFVLSTLENICS